MGREIKRVPLDFDWPLHETWHGFINPFYEYQVDCEHCNSSGYTPEAYRLDRQWYGYIDFDPSMTGSTPLRVDTPAVRAFAERNVRLGDGFYGRGESAIIREAKRLIEMWNQQWSHHLDQDDVDALFAKGRLWRFQERGVEHPTAAQVNESLVSHDSLNAHICIQAKCERLGYAMTCPYCGGHGYTWPSKYQQMLCDTWQETEPPAGDGWQLWENVSDGSPISPVLPTQEAFIDYLVSEGFSRENAEAFCELSYVPSMVIVDGNITVGIDSAALLNTPPDEKTD